MSGTNMALEADDTLLVRVAWLYYVASMNQEEVAGRLGLHRTRVTRLLSEARDRGLVSVTIQHDTARLLEVERTLEQRFGLDACLTTPPIGLEDAGRDGALLRLQGAVARRAVGIAGAGFLRNELALGPVTVGVSWGRTIAQVASQLVGVRNPDARFVSLMGSLTRNSASNPFEVVQALAARTGGEGYYLPVPFIADTRADRDVLMSQRSVAETIALARSATMHLISVGELGEGALLREQSMLSKTELDGVRTAGAVCDTLGRLFAADGREIEHDVSRRTLAFDVADLQHKTVVLLAGGPEKVAAIDSLLSSGLVTTLIVDGDTALALTRFQVDGSASAAEVRQSKAVKRPSAAHPAKS